MKKYFLLLFAFIGLATGKAQVINDMGLEGLLLETKDSDILKTVEGSPYWNEDFRYGTVALGEKQPLKAFMRYNAEKETVEIKTAQESEKTYVLPLNRKAIYVIGDEVFLYDEIFYDNKKISGYFIEHYNGDTYRLLEKPVISRSRAVKANSSYESDKPAKIYVKSELYVVTEGSVAQEVRPKTKDIKKAFPSKRAKEFLSDHKIKEKEDLVSFLEFMEQQS
ncbi:hypothetical protein [Salinimicrobium soli]|uniref:hypothetical protein n=1 Tax=Salinimicrobium soli TaxID=1254399 RepID=UPI003AAD7AA8